VIRHNLKDKIGGHQKIGIFNRETKKYLPLELRTYIESDKVSEWYKQYLKNYRDALAHRIPRYIPPAVFTPEETARYKQLEAEKVECINEMQWERLDQVWSEQDAMGRPLPVFMHSISGGGNLRPVSLHRQLLSDSKLVAEFGLKYLSVWQNTPNPEENRDTSQ